ncbi:hypothetical protein AAZX31_06G301000 [Glycine max]|uniref:GPI-anchored protein LLG1-like domain-containing protein n=1 Tax=Glycine max TaxID=3847 RepID=C6SW98_SOYBN|nr:GPI-anchored protein LLG1-like precursor [Glycine max]ACU13521.1 unknown [Glycine max]KAH1128565.1 hypothetical protein GYH30_016896 [Glycine max]KRH56401.1 hypothetical protein GLYMA_06G322100v4 [Glycine max]|eukprot:NP_001235471.1 uncharacterized protein LOC100305699 precursor [Glycine max]
MAFSFTQRFFLSPSLLLLLLLIALSASSLTPTCFSDSVFDSQAAHAGRNLLQAKKSCPVNFEFLNYTVITSKCKGPQYPPKQCCAAFKEFACPYANALNDSTNDCAAIMFSYINLYGKYPFGFFASVCRQGKKGITINCPASAASPPSVSEDDTGMKTHQIRV